MKINFCLHWAKNTKGISSAFKHSSYFTLIDDYMKRLARYTKCEMSGALMQGAISEVGLKHWYCHPIVSLKEPSKVLLSSEDLAEKIIVLRNSSVKGLLVHIGGPDGFSDQELKDKADFVWSFGKMTLPHELATLVAVEQVYRAHTIIAGAPYHLGH